ncbi:beta-microseminoprotein isoform X1 [Camelus dromedarius]|uniref:beta-microseminoprotein isoform X2 n=1 Tax=Camelus dromedarius TaxID=9838 RepID=UPI00057BC600|nr:beta-microseminoprotein isoform X1 [Camelus dromedarius]XP_010983604.1 beta-microseminoprotein isoform X2 [Camelus dromedarius]
MNAILVSLVVLATLVTLCNTQCFIIPNQNSGSNECKDLDGITHPLDSQWKTENCEECSCSQNGINCCSLIAVPVDYDTEKCKKVFNKETCSYTVVERDNPENPCAVSQWVL